MTTLVGLHVPGQGTWFGSDTGFSTAELRIPGIPKWIQNSRWALGAAGDAYTIELITLNRDALLRGAYPRDVSLALQKMMKDDGYSPKTPSEGGAVTWGQTFLLASSTGLWSIDETLNACPMPAHLLWAEGSGQSYALGAGLAAQALAAKPAERVRLALQASCQFDLLSSQPLFTGALIEGATETPARRQKKHPGA